MAIQVALVFVLTSLLTAAGLISLWAALSKRHWFWRALAIVGGAALLLPTRAYEAIAFFMTLAVLVAGVLLAVRLIRERRKRGTDVKGDSEKQTPGFRFRVVDLLLLTAIASLLAFVCTHLVRKYAFSAYYDSPPFYPHWATSMLGTAGLVLAAAWLALGKRMVWARIAMLAVMMAVASTCWMANGDWFWPEIEPLSYYRTDASGASTSWPVGQILLPIGVAACTVLILTATARQRRDEDSRPSRFHPFFRPVKATSAVLLALFCATNLWLYFRMLQPLPAIQNFEGSPAAYQEILAIAREIPDASIPDPSTAPFAKHASFAAQYSPQLQRASQLLDNQAVAHLKNDFNDIEPFELMAIRFQLSYAFVAESKGLQFQGQYDLAAQRAEDCIRLAEVVSRGRLMVHWLAGCGIEASGVSQLADLRHELSSEACIQSIESLVRIDRRRETIEAVHQRDRDWTERVEGWPCTFCRAIEEASGQLAFDSRPFLRSTQRRRDAMLRLLIVELAVRAFRQENGQLPESLDELTPAMLVEMPIDPYSGEPLIYRRSVDGYLVYSVGPNARDDGGQKVDWAALEGQIAGNPSGDLFLDIDDVQRPMIPQVIDR